MKNYQEHKFEAIVNGLKCIAQVDTGADVTGIPLHLVTQKNMTGLYHNAEISTKQSQLLSETEIML